jgi:hypothetical protein
LSRTKPAKLDVTGAPELVPGYDSPISIHLVFEIVAKAPVPPLRKGYRIMPFPILTRRTTLKLGASAFVALNATARAEDGPAAGNKPYFVPAGRIGFIAPEGVETWTEASRLLSGDHGFSLDVYEQLRLGPDADDYIWEKDERSERVETSIRRDGFEIREFRDLRYGDSKDYSTRSIVLRDADWMGQVEASTQNLGLSTSPPEGQIARWRETTEAVFASITIRPQPPIERALAEVGIRLDAPHLHPRITGRNLILSLSAPRSNSEAWAANGPAIRCASVMNLAIGGDDEGWEKLIQDQFEMTREMARRAGVEPHSLEGPHVRGMLSAELEFMEGRFSTTLSLFSRNRFLDFTGYYDAQSRGPILAALRSIVDRIEFIEPA